MLNILIIETNLPIYEVIYPHQVHHPQALDQDPS